MNIDEESFGLKLRSVYASLDTLLSISSFKYYSNEHIYLRLVVCFLS